MSAVVAGSCSANNRRSPRRACAAGSVSGHAASLANRCRSPEGPLAREGRGQRGVSISGEPGRLTPSHGGRSQVVRASGCGPEGRGFESPQLHHVMSRDIGKARTPIQGSGCLFFGVRRGVMGPPRGVAGGLVAAVGVEGEVADDFAGGGVDDADVEVVDEHDDRGAGEGSADADVVELAVVAEGDFAGFVDAVVADAELAVGVVVGGGFGSCGVGDGGCCAVWE